jgi:hypothetical protein
VFLCGPTLLKHCRRIEGKPPKKCDPSRKSTRRTKCEPFYLQCSNKDMPRLGINFSPCSQTFQWTVASFFVFIIRIIQVHWVFSVNSTIYSSSDIVSHLRNLLNLTWTYQFFPAVLQAGSIPLRQSLLLLKKNHKSRQKTDHETLPQSQRRVFNHD